MVSRTILRLSSTITEVSPQVTILLQFVVMINGSCVMTTKSPWLTLVLLLVPMRIFLLTGLFSVFFIAWLFSCFWLGPPPTGDIFLMILVLFVMPNHDMAIFLCLFRERFLKGCHIEDYLASIHLKSTDFLLMTFIRSPPIPSGTVGWPWSVLVCQFV